MLLSYMVFSLLAFTMLLFPAKVITDRISEKSKGYGFVTFASQDEAEKAITEMNEKVIVEFITLLLFLALEMQTKISLCRH